MKVQAFTISFPPRRFIGSELMSARLLDRLVAAGHETSVLVGDGAGDWTWGGVTVTGNALNVQRRADIAIVHAGRSWPGVEYRERTGAKLVVICHNTSEATRDDVAGCRPDLVVVNSQTMRDELGVDALVINPPAPPVTPLPSGDRIVTLSLNSLKGGPQFLRLARVMPHRRFLAVKGGYGSQHEVELPNLKILDHVPHETLAERVWAHAAVFLQLSTSESWGMAASEARAHGIPVIAHPTPGLAENLGEAAVWVNRDDTAMLSEVIEQVLGDPKYRSDGLARARELEKVSESQMGEWVTAIERLGDATGERNGVARGLLSVGG